MCADYARRHLGGGGGTGVTVFPIGFLTAYPDGRVEMLAIKQEPSSPIEQVADFINRTPDLVGRFKDLFAKKKEEKEEEEAAE